MLRNLGDRVRVDAVYTWHVLGGFAVWRPIGQASFEAEVIGTRSLWNGRVDADGTFHPTGSQTVLVVSRADRPGDQEYCVPLASVTL